MLTLLHMAAGMSLYHLSGDSSFDLSLWVEEALETFPVVKEHLYKDIEFMKFPEIVDAFEDLVFQMVQNSRFEEFTECIYMTWTMSKYGFISLDLKLFTLCLTIILEY